MRQEVHPKTRVSFSQYWDLLARFLKPRSGQVVMLATTLLASVALQLVAPQILRQFIDLASQGQARLQLVQLAVVFLGVALFQQTASFVATYLAARLSWTTTNALRMNLMWHCMDLDLSFHNSQTPGGMIERIDGDVSSLSAFFSNFLFQFLASFVLLVGIGIFIFLEDWRIGVAMTFFATLSFFVLLQLRHIVLPSWEAESSSRANFFGFLEERLGGLEDIRTMGARQYIIWRFLQTSRTWLRKRLKANAMSSIFASSIEIMWAIGTAGTLAIGAYLYIQDAITIGTAYLLLHYFNMMERPIRTAAEELESLQRAGGAVVRITELNELSSGVIDGSTGSIPTGSLCVEFDRVSFRYPTGIPVLTNVSFAIEPGRVLGIVGRTGSGKTTIGRLLVRLYDPDSGTVKLGGCDLRSTTRSEIRDRVSMVTQTVHFVEGTIRDNLSSFDAGIQDEQLIDTLNTLGLLEWYMSLPDGLDTSLSVDGNRLSAGEAQLLALARVIQNDPGLLVLDEAESRIDPATGEMLKEAIQQVVSRSTTIIIAHNFETIALADDVLVIDQGKVIEHGIRQELASDPSSHLSRLLEVEVSRT